MHFIGLAALVGAPLAMAQITANTTTAAFTTPATTTTSVPENTGLPPVLGFRSLGCFNDPEGFVEWEFMGRNPLMTLGLCAAACADANLFATYFDECYCADTFEATTAVDVGLGACDIPCPGDDLEDCGGPLSSLDSPLVRRQVPSTRNLSIYIRIVIIPETVTVTDTVTGTITAVSTETVTDCPTCGDDWNLVIICFNGLCAPQNPCYECAHQRVICEGDFCFLEECTEEEWYKQVECTGDDCWYHGCEGDVCHEKVVCYDNTCGKMECYGDECNKHDFGCKGDECHHGCIGDECHPVPPCKGEECGVAPPPKVTPPPEEPITTPPPSAGASALANPAMLLSFIGAGLALLA